MEADRNRKQSAITKSYVLAGGQSRRLGQDKVFLKLDGATLLERAVKTCKEVFATVTISAKDPGKFSACECPVVNDWPGADGPLAGIIAALEDCGDGACFVTAVDFCDLRAEIITALVDTYKGQDYYGLSESNHPQPLCGIYATTIREQLMDIARRGSYGMKEALAEFNTGFLPAPVKQWRNINALSDLVGGVRNG